MWTRWIKKACYLIYDESHLRREFGRETHIVCHFKDRRITGQQHFGNIKIALLSCVHQTHVPFLRARRKWLVFFFKNIKEVIIFIIQTDRCVHIWACYYINLNNLLHFAAWYPLCRLVIAVQHQLDYIDKHT